MKEPLTQEQKNVKYMLDKLEKRIETLNDIIAEKNELLDSNADLIEKQRQIILELTAENATAKGLEKMIEQVKKKLQDKGVFNAETKADGLSGNS